MAKTKLCFEDNASAYTRGKISTEEYLDGMLVHLTGVRHSQDAPLEKIEKDGISMSIQSCLFEPDFKYFQDTTPIKRLLQSCWQSDLDIEFLGPKVLSALEPHHISSKIVLAMICVAITRHDLALLRYCFSLQDDSLYWAATTSAVLTCATTNPDPVIWDVLLENGLSRPNGQYWDICCEGIRIRRCPSAETEQDRFMRFAFIALKDTRKLDLLNILLDHRLQVTNTLLAKAALNADPGTMKVFLDNVQDEDEREDEQGLDESRALLVAANSNPRIIELLIDRGFDIDWRPPNRSSSPKSDKSNSSRKSFHHSSSRKKEDSVEGKTALHIAATMGNIEAVRVLLKNGARIDIRDGDGKTAEKVAGENKMKAVEEMLREVRKGKR